MFRKYLFFLVVLFLLIQCKKATVLADNEKKTPPRTQPIDAPEAILFDSIILINKSEEVKAFYRDNLFKTVWTDSIDRKNLIALIKETKNDGLNPNDYSVSQIEKKEKSRSKLKQKDWVNYDILLTESFQKVSNHLYNGKVNPSELYIDWDITPKPLQPKKLLDKAIRNHTVYKTLDTLRPNHLIYLLLKKSLKKIDEFPKVKFSKITSQKITPGDTSYVMNDIKKRLMYWGDLKKSDSITKIYDDQTFKAVKHFQERHGLVQDGIIGAATIAALNFSKEERKQQILVNLERWRWFSRNLGKNHLLINIPEYTLHVIKQKDTVKTHKVIVGKNKRKTPILSSRLSNLVINPTWTVPPTIIKEDLGPKASENREYFEETCITIYNMKGEVVSPLDWDSQKPNNYRYVQKPGENNSLGIVKFNFPNKHLVYLHDTNHKELFSLSKRALSSGCVRVENALDLADYILENDENQITPEKIEQFMDEVKTTGIPLKKPIFIHLWYWTASMNKNGSLEFFDDVYNLDFELYSKLRN